MGSFDVSSFFTNIPHHETIDICIDLPLKDSDLNKYDSCFFNRAQFSQLLKLAVKDNHFIYHNSLYDQIDGVAMDSPVCPSLANIFMVFLENQFLSNCHADFKPILYHRYVNDTFCLFKHKDNVNLSLNFINS